MFKRTRDFLKSERDSKKSRSTYSEKKVQGALKIELEKKLKMYLKDNDEGLFEVHPSVLGDFLTILDDSFLAVYQYEQIDKNKFIFYNKGINDF